MAPQKLFQSSSSQCPSLLLTLSRALSSSSIFFICCGSSVGALSVYCQLIFFFILLTHQIHIMVSLIKGMPSRILQLAYAQASTQIYPLALICVYKHKKTCTCSFYTCKIFSLSLAVHLQPSGTLKLCHLF